MGVLRPVAAALRQRDHASPSYVRVSIGLRDVLPVALDIVQHQTFAPPFLDIWEKFEELRQIKNDIFFSTITHKAEALFQ